MKLPVILLLLALSQLANAADLFIVRAPLPYLKELSAVFGLTIQKQIPGQEIFLVLGPEGVPADHVVRNLHNYDYGKDPDTDDDDDDDVRAEHNLSVVLAETGPGVPRLNTNSAPVSAAMENRTFVSFHGVQAWHSYLNQPSLTKIRVAETHAAYGTAGAVVAVIDTGIDPNHPLLRDYIVSGYDFVRDIAGPPSELDDLDAETRSILNPYTTAILDTFGEANPYTTAILDHATAGKLSPNRLPHHFGHGTMVSGIIRLVSPGSRIMPLKPFGADGKARLFHLLQAIYFHSCPRQL